MMLSLLANEQGKTWCGGHMWVSAPVVARERGWVRQHAQQQQHLAQTTMRWHKHRSRSKACGCAAAARVSGRAGGGAGARVNAAAQAAAAACPEAAARVAYVF